MGRQRPGDVGQPEDGQAWVDPARAAGTPVLIRSADGLSFRVRADSSRRGAALRYNVLLAPLEVAGPPRARELDAGL